MIQTPSQHISAELVASYVERTITPEAGGVVERHLAECAECRREVVEVERIIRARAASRSRAGWLPWAAAAAVAVFAIAYPLARGGPDRGVEEGVEPDRSASVPLSGLQAIVPPPEVDLSRDLPLRFEWTGAAEGSTYRFVLLDERGANVWTTDTQDSLLVLDAGQARLEPGVYFWYVDALGPDGRPVTTGPVGLRIR